MADTEVQDKPKTSKKAAAEEQAPTTAPEEPTTEAPESEEQPEPNEREQFDQAALNAIPVTPTVEDALGVERIIAPALDGWEPAPVDPGPEAVQAAENREQVFAEHKQQRLDALQAQQSTQAPADEAPGASQTTAVKTEEG